MQPRRLRRFDVFKGLRSPLAPLGVLAAPPAPSSSGELARLLDEGLEKRPLLRGVEARLAAAAALRSRAEQEWLPDLAVGGGYDYDFSRHGSFPEAVLGISLPVWAGAVSAGVREAEARERSARAEAGSARNRVLDEIVPDAQSLERMA